jgi:hypothetical protein
VQRCDLVDRELMHWIDLGLSRHFSGSPGTMRLN